MFNREKSMSSGKNGQQTIIAQGVRVEGDFTSQGDVLIEGEVTGNVQTSQHLRIGESAKIQADVSAENAVVAGEVRGNISVEGKLDLLESSAVHGDIEAGVLSVTAGAKINGRVNMGGSKKTKAKEQKVEKVVVEEKNQEEELQKDEK